MKSEGILDKAELLRYIDYILKNSPVYNTNPPWDEGYGAGFKKIKELTERGYFDIDVGVSRDVLLFFEEFSKLKKTVEGLEEFKNRVEGN